MRMFLAGLAGIWVCGAGMALSQEVAYLTENKSAMDRMMAGMAVKPTGNVDADFAAMMIPHHQGAIDMAVAELRHGKNPHRPGNHCRPAAGNRRNEAGAGTETAARFACSHHGRHGNALGDR